MPDALPYLFRWDRLGRKGQSCRVTARSIRTSGLLPLFPFPGAPLVKAKSFNSVRLEFADGFTVITSGHAIRQAQP